MKVQLCLVELSIPCPKEGDTSGPSTNGVSRTTEEDLRRILTYAEDVAGEQVPFQRSVRPRVPRRSPVEPSSAKQCSQEMAVVSTPLVGLADPVTIITVRSQGESTETG